MDIYKCRVCKNTIGNLSYVAREMMFGLREEFLYFQCSQCGCLQIAETPSDMSRFYPSDNYYSYRSSASKKSIKSRLGVVIRKVFFTCYFKNSTALILWLAETLLRKKEYKWLTRLKGIKLASTILDIGSGTGLLLRDLSTLGFTNLTGIDPFIDQDIVYPDGVHIVKKSMTDLDRTQYDLVMLNHVFEHMDNPHETFKELFKLVKSDGWLLIRIPVADCLSWRKYGVSWFQIDAPRHFFLHTVKSMAILAESSGLNLLNVEYDSDENQFYHSEKYIRNKSLLEQVAFKPKLLKKWKKHSKWLNSINDGDQACFIFTKVK